MTSKQRYLSVFILGLNAGVIYMLPFLDFIFHASLIKVLHVTNRQLASLMTIYCIGYTVLFIPGGWIADKFSIKKIIIVSSVCTAGLCFILSFSLNYKNAVVIWSLLPFTTSFAVFAANLKAVRIIGETSEQGKFFGLFQGFTGISMGILSLIGLSIFNVFDTERIALQAIICLCGIANIIGAMAIHSFYHEDENNLENSKNTSIKLTDIIKIIKKPEIWCISLVIFAGYGLYVGDSYFSPYMAGFLGLSFTTTLLISILRTYFIRSLGAPTAGIIGDKTKSISKTLIFIFLILIFFALYGYFFRNETNYYVKIAFATIAAFVSFGSYGIMWATLEETKVPIELTGTAIGVICIIGYMPNLLIHKLFEHNLYSLQGREYKDLFIYLIILSVIGIIGSLGILYFRNRKKQIKISGNE